MDLVSLVKRMRAGTEMNVSVKVTIIRSMAGAELAMLTQPSMDETVSVTMDSSAMLTNAKNVTPAVENAQGLALISANHARMSAMTLKRVTAPEMLLAQPVST